MNVDECELMSWQDELQKTALMEKYREAIYIQNHDDSRNACIDVRRIRLRQHGSARGNQRRIKTSEVRCCGARADKPHVWREQ
jgi:hypothetical protein